MAAFRQSRFGRCALASGLLTAQQLDEARKSLRAADKGDSGAEDRDLADALVELGLLNAWQAKQLLDGRTKFTLGPYRIVDSIGQGGMGHVYKAEDLLGRAVAVKVLPRDRCTPEAVANFNREVQAQASLNHPKLVRALDAGHDGNVYYLVTEYVPGSDLRKLVRRHGALNMEPAASIVSQVAEGLQHAHQHGLVHRDVKPGNVLVTPEGEAKLSDLGLAGPMYSSTEQDPRYGKIVGTADYLSPDHIMSPWNPTPAWDIYSLGCTLYYAVTGKVPFPGGTTGDKARAHCELRPLDPRRLNHQLSDPFVDVLADMMAKDPAQRIASAAEVIARIEPWACRGSKSKPPSLSPQASPAPAGSGPVLSAPILPSPPPPGTRPAIPAAPLPGQAAGPSFVLPPPVVAWPSGSTLEPIAAGSPLPSPVLPLRDTVADLLGPTDAGPDSDDSPSLIVETRQPISIALLLLLVLAPIVLTAVTILICWVWDVMF